MISLLFAGVTSGTSAKGLFSKVFNDKIIVVNASGSSKQYVNGSKSLSKPEYAIYPWDKEYDWCSNCGLSKDDHPWIVFSLDKKKIKFNGYFVRSGCCYDANRCCCEDEHYNYCIDCCLYSWSLQISDDNKEWKDVHKIERDNEMRYCREKSYSLDQTYETIYVRLIQNEACPGDPPCIALNKFELFGEVIPDGGVDENFVSYHDDDDDVSIIGHISKNGNVKID